ncbi:Zn-finger domains containing protein [Halapricum desulfuricans]|uniref:Zn-finger domains containing protein n=1 Tax=Halapricum desulfuricans TaxID=2841257 RepID=A0A897NJX6_9EURY|nr:hypothetical protein [Halapricum desulfuricans]QSG11159.1 Zn-finger domains containing protein [Halapricum desulfuricans]
MSLKCSIFGHAFEESTVEREREEQGSEVVITIREIQTCTRCGETRVVSENKEVTTLETPDEIGAEPESADAGTDTATDSDTADVDTTAESRSEADTATTAESQPGVDTIESRTGVDTTASESEVDTEQTADESPSPSTAGGSTDSESGDGFASEEPPVTDDAEILDDDSETPERDPGQWPQEAGDDSSTPDAGPDIEEAESEGIDQSKTDAELLDDDVTESSPQTNEWPSEDEIDAASDPDTAGPGAVTVPEGSYVCRECGFSTPAEESSLREGDFCPECHRGTLVHTQGT